MPLPHRKATPLMKRRLYVLFSLITCLVMGAARQAAAADDSYYYSGGQRHPLPVATQWLAVQLNASGQAATVAAAVKTRSALDTKRAVRKLRRFNVAILPLQNARSVAARSTVRNSVVKAGGVQRVLRAFGDGPNPIIETDEFLVQFKQNIDQRAAARLVAARGAELLEKLGPYAPNGYLARVLEPNVTAASVANSLYESGVAVFAHPNFLSRKQRRYLPNDPLFPKQWHLRNTGQTGGIPGNGIMAEAAWNMSRGGKNTIIAVIDDGFDLQHEDLAANFLPGHDFLDDDNDPSPGPNDGHGTSCAGLAAAVGNNGIGISGVAPLCKVLPIRLVGDYETDQDDASAFVYAADHGAAIITNSWGPEDGVAGNPVQPLPDITQKGIHFAATDFAGDQSHPKHKACVIFWAAGNGNESADNDGYASNPDVISVAASTSSGQRAYYSDFGSSVDLNAPGGEFDITTTDNTGASGFDPSAYDTQFAGTSASAPIAAGVAGLMLALDPSLTSQQVKTILQNTATKIGTGYNSAGHSDYYGYGRVNAYQALLSLCYSVSGRITTSDGKGVPGVTVTSSNLTSTVTDSNGNYVLPQAGRISATLTASRAGYIFTPSSRTLSLNGNMTGVNFSALNYVVTLVAPANQSTVSRTVDFVGRTNSDAGTSKMSFEYRNAPYTQTVTSGQAIPDNNTDGLISSYTTDRVGYVQSATVSVDITHTYVGDLVVSVIAPDGREFILQNGADGGAQSLKKTFTLPIGTNLPPLGARWQLKVRDMRAGDTGKLNSWSMTVDPAWGLGARDTDGPASGNWTGTWNILPFPVGAYQVRCRAYYGDGSYLSPVSSITIAPGLWIGGRITSGGAPVANVMVSRSGSTEQVKTGPYGYYTFMGVPRGTYTITPMPSGGYSPASKSVTVTTSDALNQDFTRTATTMGSRLPISTVHLSAISAGQNGAVKLVFTGALSASAVDPSLYETDAEIESASVQNETVTLAVAEGTWATGQRVTIAWHGLRDASNRSIADGSATTTVR